MTPSLPDRWHWHEGNFLPGAVVDLADRGFRYGQHLFATVAVRQGRPHRWAEHLHRLRADGAAAGFVDPPGLWESLAGRSLPREISGDGILRLFWTAGPGAPSDPPAPGDFFLWWEAQSLPTGPIGQIVAVGGQPVLSPGPGWKTGNYWSRLLEWQEARRRGAGEVLLFSPAGFLSGAALANVFFRRDGQWWTPPVEDGARPGVTRAWLLGQGWAREARLPRQEWSSIESLALANARLGPVPVTGFSPDTTPPAAWDHSVAEDWSALWQAWLAD